MGRRERNSDLIDADAGPVVDGLEAATMADRFGRRTAFTLMNASTLSRPPMPTVAVVATTTLLDRDPLMQITPGVVLQSFKPGQFPRFLEGMRSIV